MMPKWRSIRFRLSVQYSAVVFGLGGVLLGGLYLALRNWLQSQTMMGYIVAHRWVEISNGLLVQMPQLEEVEMQAIQTVFAQETLDRAAQFTFVALLGLFLLSLIVGWVMSGRVLKPVGRITSVARDIQASDLSRRIALEGPDDELTRLASTFDGMLDRLDAAFTSQRQFLADTSHDLRTPLAVIQSNVELVADDPGASIDDWQEAGGVVRRNTEKMSEMIDGLLAAARMQTGKAQAVAVDLAGLIRAKAADFEKVVAERDIIVEVEAESAHVEGVEVSLDRALSNLIDNASRVAPGGSTIRLASGVVEHWAYLSVQDEGPGLPDDEGDHIGLGLSIVRQIAEVHGGSLAPFPGPDDTGTLMVIWLATDTSEGSPPAHRPNRATSL